LVLSATSAHDTVCAFISGGVAGGRQVDLILNELTLASSDGSCFDLISIPESIQASLTSRYSSRLRLNRAGSHIDKDIDARWNDQRVSSSARSSRGDPSGS
jgi:hypothetical protein